MTNKKNENQKIVQQKDKINNILQDIKNNNNKNILLCWGWGSNGQLGMGDQTSRIKPQTVEHLLTRPEIKEIASGSRFTIAVTIDGNVFAWGKNDDGQLGTGDYKSHLIPHLIESLSECKIKTVTCKGSHVLALSNNNNVYSWGRGDEGQLGHGTRESCCIPKIIESLKDKSILKIDCGRTHSVAVSSKGFIYSWGSDEDGALAQRQEHISNKKIYNRYIPHQIESLNDVFIFDVKCGSRHTLALTNNGKLYAWGWNIYGQLGIGDTTTRFEPVSISFLHKYYVKKIITGFRHCFAITSCTPSRSVDTLDIHISPDTMKNSFLNNNLVDVWAWGWNQYGQLGLNTTEPSVVVTPRKVESLSHINLKYMAAGGRHSICTTQNLLDNKRIGDMYGYVKPRAESEPLLFIEQQNKNYVSNCKSNVTFVWGRGDDGQLGTGFIGDISSPTIINCLYNKEVSLLSCGWAHTCALIKDTTGLDDRKEEKSILVKIGCMTSFHMSSGDFDGFFGLFVQSLIQLMLIYQTLPSKCGFPLALISSRIVPSVCLTICLGNLFFYIQAINLMRKEKRNDVTAQPEGINTVLILTYTLLIMYPEYQLTKSYDKAWEVGIFSCIMTGLLQILLLPSLKIIKNFIPRAALLSSVAGIGLTFLSMGFIFEIWQNPLIAIGPLFLIFICYGAKVRLPLGIPTGLGALIFGTSLAFIMFYLNLPTYFIPFSFESAFQLEFFTLDFGLIHRAITSGAGLKYMSVIFPMVLVNVMSTLANLETAATVGDKFDPTETLLGDSMTTILGAFFGNPFPTSVYIGQPVYKSMGARSGYVLLNAVTVPLLSFINATSFILNIVPISCGVGFLLWIGLMITANSFERDPTSDTNHSAAVALGLLPALAAWGFQLVQGAVTALQNSSSLSAIDLSQILIILNNNGMNPGGMIALSQGYLLTSIFLSSTLVHIIEREFYPAALWMFFGSILSFFGIVHAYKIDNNDNIIGVFGLLPGGIHGWAIQYGFVYFGSGLLLLLFHIKEQEISFIQIKEFLKKYFLFDKNKLPKFQNVIKEETNCV